MKIKQLYKEIIILALLFLGSYCLYNIILQQQANRIEDITEENIIVTPFIRMIEVGEAITINVKNINKDLFSQLSFRLLIKKEKEKTVIATNFQREVSKYTPQKEGIIHLVLEIKQDITDEIRGIYIGNISVVNTEIDQKALKQVMDSDLSMKIKEGILLSLMLLLGLSFISLYRHKGNILFLLLLSFPIGSTLWVLISLVLLIIRIPFNIYYLSLILSLMIISLGYWSNKKRCFKKNEMLIIAVFLVFILSLIMLAVFFNYSILTYDSYYYVSIGKSLAFHENINSQVDSRIHEYGIFLPLIHANAIFWGLDYVSAFQPVLIISFLLFFGYCLYVMLRDIGFQVFYAIIWVSFVLCSFITTYFTTFLMLYITPNFPAGVYLFLSVYFLYKSITETDDNWLFISSLFLISFAISRVEGPLFAMIILVVYFTHQKINKNNLRCFYFPYLIITTSWYLTLLFVSNGSNFLKLIYLNLIVNLVFSLICLISFNKKFKWLRKYSTISMIYMLVIPAVILTFIKLDLAALNTSNIIGNLYKYGYWDSLWVMILILSGISLFLPVFEKESVYIVTIATYMFLLYDIFFFRNLPLRIGFGDSANRMFMHIAPILIYYLTFKFGNAVCSKDN